MWEPQVERIIGPDGRERAVILSVEDYRTLLTRIEELENGESAGGELESEAAEGEPWPPEAIATMHRLMAGLYEDPDPEGWADKVDAVVYGKL